MPPNNGGTDNTSSHQADRQTSCSRRTATATPGTNTARLNRFCNTLRVCRMLSAMVNRIPATTVKIIQYQYSDRLDRPLNVEHFRKHVTIASRIDSASPHSM
jgi:hypothetical protein